MTPYAKFNKKLQVYFWELLLTKIIFVLNVLIIIKIKTKSPLHFLTPAMTPFLKFTKTILYFNYCPPKEFLLPPIKSVIQLVINCSCLKSFFKFFFFATIFTALEFVILLPLFKCWSQF